MWGFCTRGQRGNELRMTFRVLLFAKVLVSQKKISCNSTKVEIFQGQSKFFGIEVYFQTQVKKDAVLPMLGARL